MANYYKGDEIKIAIDINAPGFDIDTDDFEIEVATRRSKVTGYKNVEKQEDTAVVIFRESAPSDSSDSDSSDSDSSSSENTTGQWYAIVDTSTLDAGEMRVIMKAYITDANANDGKRVNIDVKPLGTLLNP